MNRTILAAAIALALTAPVLAKDISLPLNDQEQQGLLQVLDRATRDGGLAAVNNGTLFFFNKLKLAVDAANAPPTPAAAEVKPDVSGGATSTPAVPSTP